MDEKFLEQASVLEQALRDDALQRFRAQAARTRASGPGQTECEDCGEDIPPARRAAAPGALRCVHCQNTIERRFKRA